ncbi:hypothetical protein LGK95_21380 [Clostridium algoriphilum]|uniref:hypothetical protein n=1 Tax=Clostridium algoriphilum TaxID=198347 RepID=UPI001CF12977|nr:hypothetical protein [Clostridium algoriphilum]MCB2296008.1 hypothetical protein [Clostridium algoriphilum]
MGKYIVKTYNKNFRSRAEKKFEIEKDSNCEMILNENLGYEDEDEDEEYDLHNIIQHLDSDNEVNSNTVILKKKEYADLISVDLNLEGDPELRLQTFSEVSLNTFLNSDKFIFNKKQYTVKEKIYSLCTEEEEENGEEDVLTLMCSLYKDIK